MGQGRREAPVRSREERAAELERLLALHQLHFFASEERDLVPLTPDLVRKLEPILLAEPVNQPNTIKGDFMYWENYDVRVRMDGTIDRVVLEDVLRTRGRSCRPEEALATEGFPTLPRLTACR